MKVRFHDTLKLLSGLCLMCMGYPFAALITVVSTGSQGLFSVLFWGAGVVSAAAGWLISRGLEKLRHRGRLSVPAGKLLSWVPVVLPGVAGYLWFAAFGTAAGIGAAAFLGICYLIGTNLYFMAYGSLLNPVIGCGAVAVNLVVILFFWYYNQQVRPCSYDTGLFVLFFLCAVLLFGIIRNQQNIDYLMERRKHKLEHLPKKIRYYNLILLGVVFLFLLLGFLSRDWIVAALLQIGEWLKLLILYIVKLVQYLLSLFQQDSPDGEEPVGQQPIFPPAEAKDSNPFPFELIVLLIIGVILFLNRKRIARWISGKWRALMGLLRQFLQRTRLVKTFSDNSEYYYDKVEELSSAERKLTRQGKGRYSWKQWKKSCRSYYKMEDSPEKLRYGYRLILDWMTLKGVGVSPSDTTLEVLEKGKELLSNTGCGAVTGYYNLLRYAEQPFCREGLAEMEVVLRGLLI